MATPLYELSPDVNGPITIYARGRDVLANPMTNRGTAFTRQQREGLGLTGLLPTAVTTIDNQLRRLYMQLRREPSNLAKHRFMASLRERNEVLYYRLLADNIEELMPIVYTPTIGEAIERFSVEFNQARGVHLSIDHPDEMEASFRAFGIEDADLVVVTDSEGILGIGDQGVGGIQIAIGKVAVYVAAAGIHPHRAIPVVLDTGTDNIGLLNNPMYLGERHARVRGARYDDFLEKFVETVSRLYPNAMLHFEDFGAPTAHPLLERYRDRICAFNDDIQGTAAVALAALLRAVEITRRPLTKHRIVVFGAGTAGVGISNLICETLVRQHHKPIEEARRQIWAFNRSGLIHEGASMREYQRPYARTAADIADWDVAPGEPITLADVVREAKPTILIGTSTMAGAFTEEIVREMASYCDRPVIMPLSNPTVRAEAIPRHLLQWTEGRALIATGSPFEPVPYEGVEYDIAQANNSLIFPGLGLGVMAVQATRVTDHMIAAAAAGLSTASQTTYERGATLLPGVTSLRPVATAVAIAVAQAAVDDGVAARPLTDPVGDIYARMWQPEYPEIVLGEA